MTSTSSRSRRSLGIFGPLVKDDICVFVEEDRQVCYAYFVRAEKITGMTWLYNRVSAMDEVVVRKGRLAPVNPLPYVSSENFELPNSRKQFSFEFEKSGALERCMIYLRGELLAIVEDGAIPGWSRFAKIDGPFARVLLKEQ